jgi:hypothetical protein
VGTSSTAGGTPQSARSSLSGVAGSGGPRARPGLQPHTHTQTPPRGAKRVGTVLKKADQGLDRAFDRVDRAFNKVGERLSRGGPAATEYGQVRLG